MAVVEQQPLSKEAFDNNADLLVFADRHVYQTRSRLGYLGSGAFLLSGDLLILWGWLMVLGVCRWPGGAIETAGRTAGYIVTPIFLPLVVVLLIMALGLFRTNPRVVISPAGVEFRNRLEFMHLRAKNFLVDFGDIEKVEIRTSADKGRYEVEPRRFRYALKIFTGDRGELLLRWNTFDKEEAVRFADAFLASMQEMATRSVGHR